jgi:hypothetical protein
MMSIWNQQIRLSEVAVSLAVLVIFRWTLRKLGRAGQNTTEDRGEAAVRRALTKHCLGSAYHLLNNVTLPFGDGTTQIDHILVSKYGIFVIEAKHYSGWIFADASSPTWTQVIFRYRRKFQNPLRQNYKHVKAIQAVLDFMPSEHIHSFVVFTGNAAFKTKRPEGVFDLDDLVQHINLFSKEVLSDNRLQFCVGRLECLRKAISGQTDVEHQAYLRQKFGDTL